MESLCYVTFARKFWSEWWACTNGATEVDNYYWWYFLFLSELLFLSRKLDMSLKCISSSATKIFEFW